MSSIFPEYDIAEIQVKKIMLEALEKEKRRLDPVMGQLSIEIDELKRDIQNIEKSLTK